MTNRIPVPTQRIPEFCRKWKVRELGFFGSVLRADFGPTSDVDIVVTFDVSAEWSLLDMVAMRDEARAMFGHQVDIVEERAVRNPYFRQELLRTKWIAYAA